jgi:chromosomal replication initiation ATPase DnaA
LTQLNSAWLQACAALDGVDPFVGRRIAMECAKEARMTLREMISRRQDRRLVLPRWKAMYRIYQETNLRYEQIGRVLGRDRTTVMHGVRAYRKLLARGEV